MVVLEAESADEWEDVVSNCFVPLRTSSLGPDFHAQIDYLQLDERISVSVVKTDGTVVERTSRLAATAANV